MQNDVDRDLFWLVLGALVGMFAVVFHKFTFGFDLPAWLGALIPLISAVVVGSIGPRLGERASAPPIAYN
ncbi:hypothetical protein [Methylosinus sporium]|uniref:Uncharacterized protein n=1 Tax=Methylosinus sporium TaxID=428 RepID=A0A2U1SUP7_METSR|nr:hypothetical protein [Methylosinus sporium]PWB95343.1 hypothetical protein C5689_03780 [Methylosinus sporium]